MAGKAGVKAGLIGLAALLVMTAINNLLPISGGLIYAACGVSLLIYAGIGVLAGFFLAPPRTPGKGAAAGAIAGALSGVINGAVGSIINVIRMAQGLGIAGLDPQQAQLLADSGLDPSLFMIPGLVCAVAIGSGLAAIGAAIFAAIQSD